MGMDNFREYVESGGNTSVDRQLLQEIVALYPWFTTARVALLRAEVAAADNYLKLSFFSNPAPKPFLEKIEREEFWRRSTDEIITAFLGSGEHRIVPQEDTPDFEVSGETFDAGDDAEFITEELAQIYLSQGHTQQAKDIYEKLSLLYPKKSVYFAEIISGIGDK